jgi:predicted metal-dependent hydrolase
MKEYLIDTETEKFSVGVIYSRRKTLELQVKSSGEVYARVPAGAPDDAVETFIEKHREWIIRKRSQWSAGGQGAQTSLPEVVTAAGKRQIRQLVTQRVAYYAEVMGISYGRISMRNQKTRWGSCSSDGNLNFNCRLLFLPSDLVDYVVVHELAHRRYMNHSPEFWREVERYMPDYRERRERLKQYRTE